MREVAVVAFAQSQIARRDEAHNEVEMLMPVLQTVLDSGGLTQKDIDFTISGSCDYVAGEPFAFIWALQAVGAWPPIRESHLEMDGAWAAYEAWMRLQCGDIDTALVYAFGKASLGDIGRIMALQHDPYVVAPLWPDAVSIAALQARALLDTGRYSERDFAEVAARNRRNALGNEYAQVARDDDPDELLDSPYIASPLRRHDCPPISDGAAAVVLAAGPKARALQERPAWIIGMDHRIETGMLGARDLTDSSSTRLARQHIDMPPAPPDVVELHAPFSHQELILREALELDDGTSVNPSGGALSGDPIMATGLIRIGEAAQRIMMGDADNALAHASSGPCLQHNLLCTMRGE